MPSIKDYFGTSKIKDITVSIPLEMKNEKIGYETLSEEELEQVVNFNLKSVILTHKGERFDPNFGVGIKTYLFEMMTTTTRDLLVKEIKEQVETYLPYLNKFKISATTDTDNGVLSLKITYKINEPSIVGNFDINLPLSQL